MFVRDFGVNWVISAFKRGLVVLAGFIYGLYLVNGSAGVGLGWLRSRMWFCFTWCFSFGEVGLGSGLRWR